jgi:hypothetical protein
MAKRQRREKGRRQRGMGETLQRRKRKKTRKTKKRVHVAKVLAVLDVERGARQPL